MTPPADPTSSPATLRLLAARATAWAWLLAGWVGIGGVALSLTPSLLAVHALVALWLLGLGIAATVATRDSLSATARRTALAGCTLLGAGALLASVQGGGLPALLLALGAWSALTALASGVVRSLRQVQAGRPGPPVLPASLGALAAALALGDPGDSGALVGRLVVLLVVGCGLLMGLQPGRRQLAGVRQCRAGLFDCSLPAWPAGAWHDAASWPALLAGLAMLPMMAALPLMVAWCRVEAVPAQAMVALHFGAMFGPALLWHRTVARGNPQHLAAVCTLLLSAGAAAALWAPPPYDLLGVALGHGAAWSLAWSGQLWSPERRSQQGSSPLRAALGYAVLTLGVGLLVDLQGARGLALAHVALGGTALLAWFYGRATPAAPAA